MSATLIPTKTFGERPPTPPPISTTFGGASDGDDSSFTRLSDDVRNLVRHADATDAERLDTMIELLDARKRMISAEILTALSLEEYPLPPMEGFPVEFTLHTNREERMLDRLIDSLESCRQRCERRLARHRFEARLLADLGASDS